LMLKLNKEFYEKKDKFLKLIKHEYKLNKLSTKLDKFHELDFDEFVKQLKIKLNFTKKEELMEYFEKNKKEVKELAEKIEKTDEEINEMVYKLYGITDKEKSIIEDY
ncbi:MAG: restriction endonuclease subunit M, partial [Nanoarchaeota archaeon]|nr:restriction endonuclease subunit M [Nanoarchaeota archaeon]